MFAKTTTQVDLAQRVVATLVAVAVVLWTYGVYTSAQAANLTEVSNTLSDSNLSVTSGHTIEFAIPAGSTLSDTSTTTITFPAGFTDVDSVTSGDITITVSGAGAGAVIDAFFVSGQVIEISLNATAGAEDVIEVAIDDGIITNPGVAQSYEFVVDTDDGDTGKTRVAIIDNVLVTAIVETAFDFTISGVASNTAVNGLSTTSSSTSATAIDFGVVEAGISERLAQELSVTTNANNGFVVTVQISGELQSSNGAVIDTFVHGDSTTTPQAWSSPVPDVLDDTTWGHWGITSDDDDVIAQVGAPNNFDVDFGADEYAAASTSPRAVFAHTGPSDGSTPNIGSTTVMYQIEITALQEAADDYNTTLTYIATPTF
jgi:hypothetical protein